MFEGLVFQKQKECLFDVYGREVSFELQMKWMFLMQFIYSLQIFFSNKNVHKYIHPYILHFMFIITYLERQ